MEATRQVKCKNCGKPIDPTSEEVLCDSCIERQQVIEAIREEARLLYWWSRAHPKPDEKVNLEEMTERFANCLLAKKYPSGQPMIAILKEDQTPLEGKE